MTEKETPAPQKYYTVRPIGAKEQAKLDEIRRIVDRTAKLSSAQQQALDPVIAELQKRVAEFGIQIPVRTPAESDASWDAKMHRFFHAVAKAQELRAIIRGALGDYDRDGGLVIGSIARALGEHQTALAAIIAPPAAALESGYDPSPERQELAAGANNHAVDQLRELLQTWDRGELIGAGPGYEEVRRVAADPRGMGLDERGYRALLFIANLYAYAVLASGTSQGGAASFASIAERETNELLAYLFGREQDGKPSPLNLVNLRSEKETSQNGPDGLFSAAAGDDAKLARSLAFRTMEIRGRATIAIEVKTAGDLDKLVNNLRTVGGMLLQYHIARLAIAKITPQLTPAGRAIATALDRAATPANNTIDRADTVKLYRTAAEIAEHADGPAAKAVAALAAALDDSPSLTDPKVKRLLDAAAKAVGEQAPIFAAATADRDLRRDAYRTWAKGVSLKALASMAKKVEAARDPKPEDLRRQADALRAISAIERGDPATILVSRFSTTQYQRAVTPELTAANSSQLFAAADLFDAVLTFDMLGLPIPALCRSGQDQIFSNFTELLQRSIEFHRYRVVALVARLGGTVRGPIAMTIAQAILRARRPINRGGPS